MNVPFLRPPLGDAEIAAVTKVLRTTALSSGSDRSVFEMNFCDFIGVKHAMAVCNGTIALDLIWQTLIRNERLKKGDKVLCPSFTFVATANSIVNAGLEPVFCDIDKETWNLDISNHTNWDGVWAILAVHTYGNPAAMEKICAYARSKGLIIVEDCAEACGACYGNRMVGAWGHASAFSFNTTKNMTTGEGGMVCFREWDDHHIAECLKEHGLRLPERNAFMAGYNFRMSNINASIGVPQLHTLGYRNKNRIFNAAYLTQELSKVDKGLVFQSEWDNCKHVHQIYAFLVPEGVDRDKLVKHLTTNGVEAKTYFDPPVHRQEYYWKNYPVDLPVTENIAKQVICLPFDDKLKKEEMDYMVEKINEAV